MKNKAFTLIELLLVISIIGLLTSIVLVSLKKAREKAKIAKTALWARSVFTELGVDAVLNLNFNDCCPGGVCTDLSEYGNDGTCSGDHCPTCTDGVPGFTGKALKFDGVNDYVDCGNDESLYLTNEITVEVWAKRNSVQYFNDFMGIVSMGRDEYGEGYHIYLDNGRVAAEVGVSGCLSGGGGLNSWPADTWTLLVLVYDTSGLKLYYQGELSCTDSYTGVGNPITTNLWIGKSYYNHYFHGTIDEVRIYKKALTAFEIQKHYAEGLLRHQLAEK